MSSARFLNPISAYSIASLAFSLGAAAAHAREVVVLKNGSIIKGDIVEQVPNQDLKMQTNDGSVLVFRMEDVEKISKEDVPAPAAERLPTPVSPGPSSTPPEFALVPAAGGFEIWTALAMPTGDFAKTPEDDDLEGIGFAEQGFAVGMQFRVPSGAPNLAWTTDLSYIMNGFDGTSFESSRYSSFDSPTYKFISALSGLSLGMAVGKALSLVVVAEAGMNFLLPTSARYRYHEPGYPEDDEDVRLEFESANSFAWSIGGGFRINRHFTIGYRYLNAGSPKVKFTADPKGEAQETGSMKGPITMGLLTIGFAF